MNVSVNPGVVSLCKKCATPCAFYFGRWPRPVIVECMEFNKMMDVKKTFDIDVKKLFSGTRVLVQNGKGREVMKVRGRGIGEEVMVRTMQGQELSIRQMDIIKVFD